MNRKHFEDPVRVIPIGKVEVDGRPPGKKEIEALASDMEARGLKYPIVLVSDEKGDLKISQGAGRKRFEAAKALGWKEIRGYIIPAGELAPIFTGLIERKVRNELSDFEIAKAAVDLEERRRISVVEFSRHLGMSEGYTYNLVRWYKNVPDEIRSAWKTQHPFLNQKELQNYSRMSKDEAISAWKKRLELKSSNEEPFMPGKSNGEKNRPRRARRASEGKIVALDKAIENSVLIPSVKDICRNIIKFVLGSVKEVHGITDYKKLPTEIVKKEART